MDPRRDTDPYEETYVEITRTQDRLQRACIELFRESDLSQPQYNALRIVRGAGAVGIPSQEIAERMITRSPDMTKLVDRLEACGLVQRTPDPEDRRRIRIVITAEGKKKLKSIEPKLLALHAKQLGHLPKRDLDTLRTLLARARESIDP
ncbi:MAG: MarR family transcriptional regulator [Planctomycetes bacterium]|nr:MarR family transcriptional regulator [Planctomycetota bacterium]